MANGSKQKKDVDPRRGGRTVDEWQERQSRTKRVNAVSIQIRIKGRHLLIDLCATSASSSSCSGLGLGSSQLDGPNKVIVLDARIDFDRVAGRTWTNGHTIDPTAGIRVRIGHKDVAIVAAAFFRWTDRPIESRCSFDLGPTSSETLSSRFPPTRSPARAPFILVYDCHSFSCGQTCSPLRSTIRRNLLLLLSSSSSSSTLSFFFFFFLLVFCCNRVPFAVLVHSVRPESPSSAVRHACVCPHTRIEPFACFVFYFRSTCPSSSFIFFPRPLFSRFLPQSVRRVPNLKYR